MLAWGNIATISSLTFNLGPECQGIPDENLLFSLQTLVFEGSRIATAHAGAVLAAVLIVSEAFAVEFQTLRSLAIASFRCKWCHLDIISCRR